MCGIFGYLHQKAIPALTQFNIPALLRHRGPDDTGWLLYNYQNELITGKDFLPDSPSNLLLLHKRLSILDLDNASSQPMTCADNRYFLIFNGEIYNYLELKQELIASGFIFNTRSDSEVLLKSYIHWGKACLGKLTGMFSFVIFDRHQKTLFCARDPFGMKPFYYFLNDTSLIFASEMKALLNFLPNKTLNSERLFHYLRSGLTDFGGNTLFQQIKQLPAGHYLDINMHRHLSANPVCYWQPALSTNNEITFSEAADSLKSIFLHNIDIHLRSDVPVATTLSGGIDSSAITMAIRHLYPNNQLHTFSYIAEQKALSEEGWIDIVNNRANTISHKVFANPAQLFSDLETIIASQDEPFGSTSIYAQHAVFKAANTQGIKVMLDGQGADELLGGYTFYVSARLASLLKQYKYKEAFELLQGARPYLGNGVFLRAFTYLLPMALQIPLRKFTSKNYHPSWINKQWLATQDISLLPNINKYGNHVLQQELHETFTKSSLPMLLRYVDRNSMAYSIESRLPFLTTQLVDFVFSLPENFLIAENGLSKAVFREAMKDIVPREILQRRDKIGFATPEKNWLMTLKPWVESILFSDYAKQLAVFNHPNLVLEWQKLLTGKSAFDFKYWRWINFIKWSEMHQIDV